MQSAYQMSKSFQCIADDTKAAACQRQNCIKKKIKYGKKRFSIWPMEFLHPAMWHDHNIDFARWLHPAMWHVALESWQWIHPVAARCNVTHSCGRWLWDDMPLNSPKRPPYWNSTSGFHFGHIIAVDMSHVILHQSAKFYPNQTNLGRKKWRECRFSKWRISAILDFRGPIMASSKSPHTTSYRSSIETMVLNCLVFEKIACLYYGDWQTDRWTNGQAHCRERRLNKPI